MKKMIFIRSISSSCSNVSNRMHQQSCRVKKQLQRQLRQRQRRPQQQKLLLKGKRRKQQLTEI